MPTQTETECQLEDQPSPAKRARLDSPPESEKVVWPVEDPSEFRPEYSTGEMDKLGKDKKEFRIYTEDSERHKIVKETYRKMHTQQTVEFVRKMIAKYDKFDKANMTIMEAIYLCDNIVDESDPDTAEANSFHMFQTAERIRQTHPDKEWLQLTGLIHDVGKVMAVWGEPQWATVGDTFPVGCAFSDKCIFPETFKDNPDYNDERYKTEYGIYQPNCGLNNVLTSWGHDEYLYRVLVHNGCKLPEPAMYMIRFHSCYPWHTGGAYDHLCNDKDREMLKWVQEFNKFDLYSKADIKPDPEKLKQYYQGLIDKFCPGVLSW